METFSALLAVCAGNSPVPGEFPHTEASDAGLWCLHPINGSVNNREAGDLRRHRAHHDVIVMDLQSVKLIKTSAIQWFCDNLNLMLWGTDYDISLTDSTTMHSEKPFNKMGLFVVAALMLIEIADALDGCRFSSRVDLAGSNITDIPRNLNGDVSFLSLSRTNIHVLNLTVFADYPVLCRLEVWSSPVSTILTPNPSQTIALTRFYLACGTFPTPSNLGIVLSRQMRHLSFANMGIITIPENYFQNYTSLQTLYLYSNPITNLSPASLVGLRHLRELSLTRTNVNPVPPLHLWLPNLNGLRIAQVGMTTLPGTLIKNLPYIRYMNLHGNQLSTVPTKEHFINLQNMAYVGLIGNPLSCDSRLAWIKVSVVIDKGVRYEIMSLIFANWLQEMCHLFYGPSCSISLSLSDPEPQSFQAGPRALPLPSLTSWLVVGKHHFIPATIQSRYFAINQKCIFAKVDYLQWVNKGPTNCHRLDMSISLWILIWFWIFE